MPRPTDQSYYVPTPSRLTIFLRTFLPWQLWRFAWINLRMVRMITIGHHGHPPQYTWKKVPSGDGAAAPRHAA